jgi:hypothetical protein
MTFRLSDFVPLNDYTFSLITPNLLSSKLVILNQNTVKSNKKR